MSSQTTSERELEKGREILRKRRQFGREVEAGEAKLSEILAPLVVEKEIVPPTEKLYELPPWLENAKLGLILRWLPGVGPATVEKILAQVPPTVKPGGLTGRPVDNPVRVSQQLSELNYRQRVALSLIVERYEK